MLNESYRIDDLEQYAVDNRCSIAQAAASTGSPLITKVAVWPQIVPIEIEVERPEPEIATSQRGDILTEVAKQIAGNIQFPLNTCFLHAMGCTAAAMTKAFKIEYGFDSIPCNLYIVTAQPPSTGKSAVNGKLYAPIFRAYKKLNEETDSERRALMKEIARLEKELTKEKSKEGEHDEIYDKIRDKEDRLSKIPEWSGTLTDTTIEAAEMVCREQDGMFSIVSAEAESINVITGAVYGDDGKSKSNIGLILNAWDGEYINTRRVCRKGYSGHVRASISVIAQDDSIDTILSASSSGRGLTERFLLLCEKSKLGTRDMNKPYRFDKSLFSRYESMIENVIREDDVRLHFTDSANQCINAYKTKIEPELGEDGEYSNAVITGFMGKADKHIRKIASVFHVADHWQDGGSRSNAINEDYALWAIGIFEELAKTFISASDTLGYVGKKSEVEKIRVIITGMAEKGKLKTTMASIRDKIKNVKPFKGSRNLTKKLRDDVLPIMEEHNYLVVVGTDIYINPRLK